MKKHDISRSAQYLVDQYGTKASRQAQENLDWSKARNDVDETRDWASILKAITELQTTPPARAGLI